MNGLRTVVHLFGGAKRFAALLVLLFVGTYWLSAPAISTTRFHPSHLGLDPLALIIFTSFAVSALHTSLSPRRIFLLVLPAAAAVILRGQVAAYSPALFEQIDWTLFPRSVYATVGYIWLLFVWVAMFPGPALVPGSHDATLRPQTKRKAKGVIAIVGIFLAYETARIGIGVRLGGRDDFALPFDFFIAIQPIVSALYGFFLLKTFLWVCPVQQ
jgi:hypothetical protein